jgi:hypothetical protein
MKAKLIGGYLVISLIFGAWGYFFGPYQHRSFFYNLGVGITWPITIFKSDPELDGSSEQAMAVSIDEMSRTYPTQILQINLALGSIAMLAHVEADESVDGDQIRAMFTPNGKVPDSMFSSMWQISRIKAELRDRLDGMEIDDLIEAGEEAQEELLEIAEDRPGKPKPLPVAEPAPVIPSTEPADEPLVSDQVVQVESGETCYEEKLAAFRTEMGEEAMVRYDMINEWRGECGLPPSE